MMKIIILRESIWVFDPEFSTDLNVRAASLKAAGTVGEDAPTTFGSTISQLKKHLKSFLTF